VVDDHGEFEADIAAHRDGQKHDFVIAVRRGDPQRRIKRTVGVVRRDAVDGNRVRQHVRPRRRDHAPAFAVQEKDGAVIADPEIGQQSGDVFQTHIGVKHACRTGGAADDKGHGGGYAVPVARQLFKGGPKNPGLGEAVFEPGLCGDDIGRGVDIFRRRLGAILRDGYLPRYRVVDGGIGDVFDDLAVVPACRTDIASGRRLSVTDR
jgi:hypothetical protein